ncbi:enoyl-CoA hydratase [Endozoicomonas ascidiicola]|uniref:enoyl-CoA hydratase n=1 Tax=Endozoicomonas ascidiicola TaxID=1698521 RepID=UPI000AC295A9|nr:enoyl-CoA hydratase [Endozoicomonas ascidiicola]
MPVTLSMKTSSVLKLSVEGKTAVLALDNPPANTWTPESLIELEGMVHELNGKPDVVALVITSASDKFFSAGADLKRFDNLTPDQARPFAEAFGRAFEALTHFNGLTIAAINGYAMGGGLEVALACDLRVAEAGAVMALPEAGVGLLPCAGGTQNLTLLVGEAWAKRMILCGETIDAEKALAIGLVEEVTEKGKGLDQAKSLAAKAGRQSPDALKACKKLIQMGRSGFSADVLPVERELFLDLFKGKNQQEGVSAFLEKRKPEWFYD